MASERILNPLKCWFSKINLKLSLNGRRSSRSSLTPCSPISSCSTVKRNSKEDEFKEVFRRFDSDGDGKISAFELRSFFGSIGEYLSHEEAQGFILDLDSDGDNLLNFQDFTKLMNSEDHRDGEEDLRKAFEMFVWEKGSDCITPKGLQRMFHRLGDEKSYDECVAMIDAFDIDRNGVLDFNEFHQMMA
ncbi:probable calcium-binding protein CML41 [Abrus precatorius]|uniref:Probable calcium-binding protein CML41 n=1 Tax=Abrus precatorius TaxID=3816 RepID=A0A8B8M4W8_ABRPR|nr:probable calcium-binding protein CML41 [Abrus precatorius]